MRGRWIAATTIAVSLAAGAVLAAILFFTGVIRWSREDAPPCAVGMLIKDASTGRPVKDCLLLTIHRESGEYKESVIAHEVRGPLHIAGVHLGQIGSGDTLVQKRIASSLRQVGLARVRRDKALGYTVLKEGYLHAAFTDSDVVAGWRTDGTLEVRLEPGPSGDVRSGLSFAVIARRVIKDVLPHLQSGDTCKSRLMQLLAAQLRVIMDHPDSDPELKELARQLYQMLPASLTQPATATGQLVPRIRTNSDGKTIPFSELTD